MCGLETTALTERDNRRECRFARTKTHLDKRRMDELRDRVKESLKKKLVKSRLKWAGHVNRMGLLKIGKESRCPEI